MAPSTSRPPPSLTTVSNGSLNAAVNAFTPLQFCEILRACWVDRTEGTTVPITEQDRKKQQKRRRKGKGRADSDDPYDSYSDSPSAPSSSSSNSTTTKSRARNTATTKKRQILQQGKSFYVRVDLSASPSCVKHIHQLQKDQSVRNEVDRLVILAQSSAESPSCSLSTREESGNNGSTSSLPASPNKRQFRTAQQILHEDTRAETLERRIYLRLLISRTILRYVEKNTGCKYLFKGDRVDHYQSQYTTTGEGGGMNGCSTSDKSKKARCTFWYECASADYEQPPCAGTMRIVVVLDLGSSLTKPKNVENEEDSDNMSVDEDRPQNHHEALRTIASTSTPARNPVLRTYGSRSRNSSRYHSIPLSSQATRHTPGISSRLSSAHPSSNTEHQSDLPPFVFAIRITHVKPHKESYAVLRARYKASRAEAQSKLDKIQKTLQNYSAEFERIQGLEKDKNDMFEESVQKLWNKARKLTVPAAFQSDESNITEEDEDAGEQEAEEEDAAADDDDDDENENDSDSEEAEAKASDDGTSAQAEDQAEARDTGSPAVPDISSGTQVEEAETTDVIDAESDRAQDQPRPNGHHASVTDEIQQVPNTEEEDELESSESEQEEREESATPVKKRSKPDPDYHFNKAEHVFEPYKHIGSSRKKPHSREAKNKDSTSGETGSKPSSSMSKISRATSRIQSVAPSSSNGQPSPSTKQDAVPPSHRRYLSGTRTSSQPPRTANGNMLNDAGSESGSDDKETDYEEPVPKVASTSSLKRKPVSKGSGSSTPGGSRKTPSRSSSNTLVNGSSAKPTHGRTLRSAKKS